MIQQARGQGLVMTAPRLVILDVNETLSDLGPLRDRFRELSLTEQDAAAWFAGVLRDGFALTVLEESSAFADLGRDVLRDLAPDLTEEQIDSVIATFGELPLHDDVAPGLRALAEADISVVTLSNGSTDVAEGLLQRGGVRDLVVETLSVDAAGIWKPHRAAYAYALERHGVPAAEAALIAVHPWDLHGASRAGLRTAWVRRGERHWPGAFAQPQIAAPSFEQAARRLTETSSHAAERR